MVTSLRAWFISLSAKPDADVLRQYDILCYSGLPWRKLKATHASIIEQLDVIIAEPYVDTLPVAPLRGSSNQCIHRLTPLAEERYGDESSFATARMQVTLNDQDQFMAIGIPAKSSMQRLQLDLAKNGVVMDGTSWA